MWRTQQQARLSSKIFAAFTFASVLSGNNIGQAFSTTTFAASSSRSGGAFPISSALTTGRSTATGITARSMASSPSSATATVPTWEDLKSRVSETPVGRALDKDAELRQSGRGSPNVHSKIRLFEDNSSGDTPAFTLYRDHAGWCPYCQKTMLLIEAKEIPINIDLVNMRSYGDKPRSFLQKVPNGMLPALEENGSGKVTLDSAYIMGFLEDNYASSKGYKRMVPSQKEQSDHYQRYRNLMGLERELFSWWCTLVFRPEQPNPNGGGGNPAAALAKLLGKIDGKADGKADDDDDYVSGSMQAFLRCMETVDDQLTATKGPYFLDYADHPTMIDFVFASHIERMLASCAYWKGMDLRDPSAYPRLGGVRAWMDALEKHEYYLAFKSDYYTHVKDIPPQYGPGSNGVSRFSKIEAFQANLEGRGNAWKLPLEDDEVLQPLYRGIPLPKCVLEAAGISADDDGSYASSGSIPPMREACQTMAAWKLCQTAQRLAPFAARGGPKGAKNIRKPFGAELADPFAKPDESLVEPVGVCLRVVVEAMLSAKANELPEASFGNALVASAGSDARGVAASLVYLRDRIGVPRDLPLAAARYARAYLNWAIEVLESR